AYLFDRRTPGNIQADCLARDGTRLQAIIDPGNLATKKDHQQQAEGLQQAAPTLADRAGDDPRQHLMQVSTAEIKETAEFAGANQKHLWFLHTVPPLRYINYNEDHPPMQ